MIHAIVRKSVRTKKFEVEAVGLDLERRSFDSFLEAIGDLQERGLRLVTAASSVAAGYDDAVGEQVFIMQGT